MIASGIDSGDQGAELDQQELLAARLAAFAEALTRRRDEAIAGRVAAGIEDEWRQAEAAYLGVEAESYTPGKPVSPDGGASPGQRKDGQQRSRIILNITRPYVDAAAARVADMLLPTDDSPWNLKPTPRPSAPFAQAPLAAAMGAPAMPALPAPGMDGALPAGLPALPGAAGPMPGPMAGPMSAAAPVDPELAADDAAKQAAELAAKHIEDWLVECQWHAEVRKVIEDAARLGTGVLKGPVPAVRRSRAMRLEGGTAIMVIEEVIAPESRAVSPWDFFPDPAAGECIHDGAYVWERDGITRRGLRELKDAPGYLAAEIDKALEEGPAKDAQDKSRLGVGPRDSDRYTIWYYHGTAEREDLDAADVQGLPDEGDVAAHVIVTMVNDRIIKAALSPLESGDYPYDVMPWQRRPDVPYGVGVGSQINVPQRMLTGAVRNLMDNAGLSAGPQIIARRVGLKPANSRWEITPRKLWFVEDNSDITDVREAFAAINIPTMQAELQAIIDFALKMAEDTTGLPAMLQGQNTHAPDTVGGMQMLQANAGTVLRRIARLFDDRITEPHIRRYYEWLMLHGEDAQAKGDFQIDARGSTALVERDLQNQAIVNMGQLVANPAFGIDPKKWLGEMLRSQRLDPKRFQLDEQQQAAMAQQPPPPAPQVQAAQIRAEADMQKAQLTEQTKVQLAQLDAQTSLQIAQSRDTLAAERVRVDTDRDAIYVQAQTARDAANANAKLQELALRRELAMLDYANRRELTLDQVKADLAKKAMEINATRELAGLRAPADMLPKPPIEPPGLAPAGESYQK